MYLSSQHFEPAEIGEEGKERHEWRRDLGGKITDRRPDCLEPNVTAPVARCASHPPRRAERPVRRWGGALKRWQPPRACARNRCPMGRRSA